MKYKIGYIDEDPGQVARYERKLRDSFDVIDYNITIGLPLEELIQRVYDSKVDLLMIDYLLVDKGVLTYNGDQVARSIEEILPRFPMLIFTNNKDQAFPQVDNPNIIYDKYGVQADLSHFIEVIEKNIRVYKDFINKKKDIINQLIEKSEKEALSAVEKNALLEAQLELKNLDKWSKEAPLQLLNEKKIQDLSKVRKEAEEYLNTLLNKNK